MRYVTVKGMRALEAAAIARGMTASLLMENAGRAVADEAKKMSAPGPVAVFCGYGNNGGDGFVAARYLIGAGYGARVFLAGPPRAMSAEAAANRDKLPAPRCVPEPVNDSEGLAAAAAAMRQSGLVIDALFGVGLARPLDGLFAELIGLINGSGRPILAVDVPSGLDADTGEPLPVAVRASKTVTLGYPKAGFKAPGADGYIGELIVADIGL